MSATAEKQPVTLAPDSHPAIQFSDVGFHYNRDRWVLRRCSGTVQHGRVFALLGPNGRGKTTLMKLLLGILTPAEGRIERHGQAALVPQLFSVAFDYSVLDMVLMGRAKKIGLFSQPSERDREAALQALDRFGMRAFAPRPFHELSGGERQMVIIARALVSEAQILVLDEPTSSLDLKNQAMILSWMRHLRSEGLTVVLTTHYPHHALSVADDALLMLGTDRFLTGPAQDVLTEEALGELYGVPLKRVAFTHDGRTLETFAPVFDSVC